MNTFSRREALKVGGLTLISSATMLSCSNSGRQEWSIEDHRGETDVGPFQPESGKLITDRSKFPAAYNEAPILAKMVADGRLPPVHERIGLDPIVLDPLHEIGRYGGTLRRAFVGPGDWWGIVRFASGPDSFLYWDKDWQAPRPNIARGFEFTDDYRVLTLYLRRGMRWSDGAPFTADDVIFWYEDMYLDRRVVAAPSPSMQVDGQGVRIEKLDDATISFISPKPYGVLVELLASATDIGGPAFYGKFGLGGFAPKHYLARFHPKYRSEKEVNARAREAGFAGWSIYLKNRNDWTVNTQLPVACPWCIVSPINSQKFQLLRNPYSIWVDTAGNQLPYIDRIANRLCAGSDAVGFKAVAGQLDFQNRHLQIKQLPFLLKNRKRSGYKAYLNPYEGTDLGLRINLSVRDDPEIGRWLREVAFRRALSLGVDREEINETMMLGLGRPSASVPSSRNRYYPGDDWMRKWAVRDVTRANRLLDELGLVERDKDGFRLRVDGNGRIRLNCMTMVSHFDYTGIAEMIREQWKDIAIDLDVQVVEQTLYIQRSMSGEAQLGVMLTGTDDPYTFPDFLFPYTTVGAGAIMGLDYARWFQSNGESGVRPPGEIVEMIELWRAGRQAPRDERISIGKEIIRRHVDQAMSIGIVSGAYSMHGIHLVNEDLGNVPRRVVNTQSIFSPANALPMTFYYKNRIRP